MRLIYIYIYIYIYIWGAGSLGLIVRGSWGQGARPCVILVLRECIWNAPSVSLALPASDDTVSLGSPPRQVVYHPWFYTSTLVDSLPFLYG